MPICDADFQLRWGRLSIFRKRLPGFGNWRRHSICHRWPCCEALYPEYRSYCQSLTVLEQDTEAASEALVQSINVGCKLLCQLLQVSEIRQPACLSSLVVCTSQTSWWALSCSEGWFWAAPQSVQLHILLSKLQSASNKIHSRFLLQWCASPGRSSPDKLCCEWQRIWQLGNFGGLVRNMRLQFSKTPLCLHSALYLIASLVSSCWQRRYNILSAVNDYESYINQTLNPTNP